MIDLRAWLQGRLTQVTVTTLLGEGAASVFQRSSFESVPEEKPFVVHHLGLSVPELKDDNLTIALSTPAAVWVHDLPGDYGRIDAVLNEIKGLFETAPLGLVMRAEWNETSEDLQDPEMGTIMRVGRFRLVHTP